MPQLRACLPFPCPTKKRRTTRFRLLQRNCFDSLRHKDSTQPTQPLRTYLSKKKKGDFVGDKGQAHDLASCSIFDFISDWRGVGSLERFVLPWYGYALTHVWLQNGLWFIPRGGHNSERRSFLFFSYSVAIGLSHGAVTIFVLGSGLRHGSNCIKSFLFFSSVARNGRRGYTESCPLHTDSFIYWSDCVKILLFNKQVSLFPC